MVAADVPLVAKLELGGSRGPEGWVAWQLSNYAKHGFGLWILETHDGAFIGDCGLTMLISGLNSPSSPSRISAIVDSSIRQIDSGSSAGEVSRIAVNAT